MAKETTKNAPVGQDAPGAEKQNPRAPKPAGQTKAAAAPAPAPESKQPAPAAEGKQPAPAAKKGQPGKESKAPTPQSQGKAASAAAADRPADAAGSKPAGGAKSGGAATKAAGKGEARPGNEQSKPTSPASGGQKATPSAAAGQKAAPAAKGTPTATPSTTNGRPNVSATRPGNNAPASATKPGSQSRPGAESGAGRSNRPAPVAPASKPGATARPAATSQAARGPAQAHGNGNHGNGKGPQRGPAPAKAAKGPASAPAATATAAARPAPAAPAPVTEIVIGDHITVRELAEKMHRSAIDIIKTLMNYGIMVPITQTIDFDTAQVVGSDLGINVIHERPPEPEVTEPVQAEEPKTLRQQIIATEKPEDLVVRPPIVTVLGHVDHGKTTLLDAIRETRVVEGEAGGITQHIGAYQVERQGRKITFLDTPGHEAFTAMRARGAMVTDIAVLVVAADDGVMPQTKEAIAHARAAKVPIVVALNKIDKPTANPERVKQELADNGLLIEEYGGDVICVPVSAKFRRGIDDLLENILLVADIDPLKANPNGKCIGTVIESRLDKTRGPLATLLVQNGTLRVGDSIVAGDVYGKIRALYDDKGRPINEAPPSTPVVVLGLSDVPTAGDTFTVEADERTARAIAAERQEKRRAEAAAAAAPKAVALENIFAQAQSGQIKELNLILKCDVQGSLEPIVSSLEKLGDEKLHVKILHQATGNITESDVMLAIASKAIILGFNVSVDPAAQRLAESDGVDIRVYDVIYNIVEDVEKALKGMLEPVYKEVILGHAEVRAVFRVSKVGKVAGCYVTDGEVQRGALVRVKRGGETIREDRINTLKRFQEDVTEVKAGFECGISLNNFHEIEVGDVLEVFKKERVSQEA